LKTNQILRHQDTIYKLTIALTENPSPKDDVEAAIDKTKTEMVLVEKELSAASENENDMIDFVSFGLNYVSELKARWWELDHEQQQVCKQLLFPAGFSVSR
jgi:hypothetical protein